MESKSSSERTFEVKINNTTAATFTSGTDAVDYLYQNAHESCLFGAIARQDRCCDYRVEAVK